MADKINWKGIPGLTVEVIKELTKLPGAIAEKAFESLSSREGSLANITADQVKAYRETDQGDASSLSVQSGAEGRVRPTEQETFAGRPADFARDDPSNLSGTFASGFTPIENKEVPAKAAAQEKSSSLYTRNTALKDTEGELLTEKGITDLGDEDVAERYTVFFGEAPKDSNTARKELLELFKSFDKSKSSLLD